MTPITISDPELLAALEAIAIRRHQTPEEVLETWIRCDATVYSRLDADGQGPRDRRPGR